MTEPTYSEKMDPEYWVKRCDELQKKLDEQQQLNDIIKRFLRYSFVDVHYIWYNLTEKERTFCTKEEFEKLAAWTQS